MAGGGARGHLRFQIGTDFLSRGTNALISQERERTHTHTQTPLSGALDTPPQSNLFTLSRCCSCRRWGASDPQPRKPAPENERVEERGRPGSGTAAPRPLLPLPPPTPPPPPGRPQPPASALPGRPYLREASGEGGERPPACANSCLLGRPRSASPRSGGRGRGEPSAQERGGKGHAARGESRAGGEASPSASLPPRPRGQVSAPRTPGPRPAPLACARAAPGRPGHSSASRRAVLPRPPEASASVAATRSATLRARGHRGRYYLEGSAALVRLLPGTRGFLSSEHGGYPSWPPSSALPPCLGRWAPSLHSQLNRVELRYLIILLLLCLSHRFPGSHVVERGREREADWQSVGDCSW